MDPRLLGLWASETDDGEYGATRLHFYPNGDLLYVVKAEKRDEVFRLTYTTQGDLIISDQPSDPRQETTRYWIDEKGILSLEYDGVCTRYRRV